MTMKTRLSDWALVVSSLLLLTLSILVSGCVSGNGYSHREGQELAEQIVWNELYEMTGTPCPSVEWVHADYLWGTTDGFTVIGSRVIVADHGGDGVSPIQVSALAHEFMHYRTWLRTGDVDPLHERGDWVLAGRDGAQLALAEAGL